ncbi:hypothetical protein B0H65DRAFT_445954 [Neurospora tetraspora]|uniref:Uncharacterized protein n=1 Tax=Neurospora tetraspora TaxID=94610 RepID=A0AAE0J6W0_9PEZI|nr:hypothetical protein B0H65DRAFT_445954 [Neurospora tetraspora]
MRGQLSLDVYECTRVLLPLSMVTVPVSYRHCTPFTETKSHHHAWLDSGSESEEILKSQRLSDTAAEDNLSQNHVLRSTFGHQFAPCAVLECRGDTRCTSASKFSRDFKEAPEGVQDASDIGCLPVRRDMFNLVITATCHWFSNCTIGSKQEVFGGQVKSRTILTSRQLGRRHVVAGNPNSNPPLASGLVVLVGARYCRRMRG